MTKEADKDTPAQSALDKPPVYGKEQLFGDAQEIHIDHRGLRYRLRETRNGKLILNL